MHRFTVETRQHTEFINIDAQVRQVLRETGLENAASPARAPHHGRHHHQ